MMIMMMMQWRIATGGMFHGYRTYIHTNYWSQNVFPHLDLKQLGLLHFLLVQI